MNDHTSDDESMRPSYGTIHIKPSLIQFVINELPLLIMCLAASLHLILANDYKLLDVIVLTMLSLTLIARLAVFRRISFTVTGEQLVFEHGLLNHRSDYIELYRVVDFQETRSPMQQLLGLKTVSIYSGDRTTPKLSIIGVKRDINLVAYIRARVELNKQMKGVYEITNR